MPIAEKRSVYPVSVEALFAWHARPGALQRMTPPWEAVRVVSHAGGIEVGAQIELVLRVGPVPVRWLALHDRYEENRIFRDIQVRGPFARWEHEHRFEAMPAGAALTDHVEYALPFAPFGAWFGGGFARARLERNFRYRHALLGLDLERHARYQELGTRRFVLSGATGAVSTALAAFLGTGGHTVSPGLAEMHRGQATPELEGVDCVIHFLRESASEFERVRQLSGVLARLTRKPACLIVVSDLPVAGAEAGVNLAQATESASEAGIRTVHLRAGVVLTPAEGLLRQQSPWFSTHRGGRDGQPLCWISLDDLLGAIQFAVFTDTVAGQIQAVAPECVSLRVFRQTLRKVLLQPSFVRPGGLESSRVGGSTAAAVLDSRQETAQMLQSHGFALRFAELEEALCFSLGKELPCDG